MLLPTALLAMPAPCCLRWALPRPPEWLPKLCLLVIVLLTGLGGTRGNHCALQTGQPSDGASRAYLAPQVVEAELRSTLNSSLRVYEAIFYVTRSYKKYRGPGRIKKKQMVSLPFRRPGPGRPINECLVVADLKINRKYFLFLSGAQNSHQPIQNVAAPVPSTKKSKKRIRSASCRQCAEAPSVGLLRGDTIVRGQSVNLTCTFHGNPPPVILWRKDDLLIKPIRGDPNVQILTKRIRISSRKRKNRRGRQMRRRIRENRRNNVPNGAGKQRRRKTRRKNVQRGKSVQIISVLSIKNSKDTDAGVYSCTGKSVVGEASAKATLAVVESIVEPGIVFPCPYDSYCLNGGTCMFFKHFGEFVCQCAEGYKGQRCQEKEVFPRFRDHSCRGSAAYTASRCLRSPRNQPKFIWEILQQSLPAKKHKVSPWSKAHHLTWSPGQMPWSARRDWSSQNLPGLNSKTNFTHTNNVRRKGQLLQNLHNHPSSIFPSVDYLNNILNTSSSTSSALRNELTNKSSSTTSSQIGNVDDVKIMERRLHHLNRVKVQQWPKEKEGLSTPIRKKKVHPFRHQKWRRTHTRHPWTTRSSMSLKPTAQRNSYLYPTSMAPSVPTFLGSNRTLI